MKKLILFWTVFSAFGANTALAQAQPARLWVQIPFIQGGDVGQYNSTMSQGRDGTRKKLWGELMTEVKSLAQQGVPVEMVLEPMAKILLQFNDIYDSNKSRDSVNIGMSLEAQFKGQFDNLFREWDIRDNKRKVQLAEGNLRQDVINLITAIRPVADAKSARALNNATQVRLAHSIYSQLDYTAYGEYSSYGAGSFQLTLNLLNLKTGSVKSFTANGRLTEAVGMLAQQLFDFFQKNQYAAWETPYKDSTWIPVPVSSTKFEYTFEEARQYCQQRGYRLPYAKELAMAASGTHYQEGGISSLRQLVPYAVADQRQTTGATWLTLGHESMTGGPVQPSSYAKGSFWCVKGSASSEVLFNQKLWKLIRENSGNIEVLRALHTIRLEIADYGAQEEFFIGIIQARVFESVDEAIAVLKRAGIYLAVPKSLLRN